MKRTNKRRFKKNKNRKVTNYILMVLALIIIFLIPLIVTLSRYAIDSINNYFARTKEFYFLSDKLTTDNYPYVINNWSGVDDYIIAIHMSSMENNLLKTSYDIDYDITYTASSQIMCQLSKTSGTILASTNEDTFTLTITPATQLRDGDSVSVSVKVESKTAFEKTLEARFTLRVAQEQLSYSITDKINSPYMTVNITNSLSYYVIRQAFGTYNVGDRIKIEVYRALSDVDKAKCSSAEVKVDFDPTRYVLDMTNKNYLDAITVTHQMIDGHSHINGITFAIDAVSSTNVRLYKRNILENNTYPAPGVITPAATFTVVR